MTAIIYHIVIGIIVGLYVILAVKEKRIPLFILCLIFWPLFIVIETYKKYKLDKKLKEEIDKRNDRFYN